MKYSIIIPIYKEKKNLKKLIKYLNSSLKFIKHGNEIIFVDDDSMDGSISEFKKNKKKNMRFYVRKKKPRDLSKSVVYGFKKARYENLAVMDGDLQHSPKDLLRLIKEFEKQKFDIVVGSRNLLNNNKLKLNILRFYVSKFLNFVTNFLFGLNLKDPMSGFFIIKKNIFKKCEKKLFLLGYKVLLDIILCSSRKIKIKEIYINFKSRDKGFSKMRLKIISQLSFFLLYNFFIK